MMSHESEVLVTYAMSHLNNGGMPTESAFRAFLQKEKRPEALLKDHGIFVGALNGEVGRAIGQAHMLACAQAWYEGPAFFAHPMHTNLESYLHNCGYSLTQEQMNWVSAKLAGV